MGRKAARSPTSPRGKILSPPDCRQPRTSAFLLFKRGALLARKIRVSRTATIGVNCTSRTPLSPILDVAFCGASVRSWPSLRDRTLPASVLSSSPDFAASVAALPSLRRTRLCFARSNLKVYFSAFALHNGWSAPLRYRKYRRKIWSAVTCQSCWLRILGTARCKRPVYPGRTSASRSRNCSLVGQISRRPRASGVG
jgi:hypothetical protein